ncbi:MAG TPA: peptidylprolyl isomerase, partial [bacterium]|nr:peptidylprolyl isomerase [bacterium]
RQYQVATWARMHGWDKDRAFQFVSNFRRNKVLAMACLETVQVEPPTQQQAREFFDNNPELFQIPVEYDYLEFYVAAFKEKDYPSPADVFLANEGLKQAFSTVHQRVLAGERVEDVSGEFANLKGRFWVLPRTSVSEKEQPQVMNDAFAALSIGEYSSVFETQRGFHFVQLERRSERSAMDWQQAEQQALKHCEMNARYQAQQSLIEEAYTSSAPTLNEKAIARFEEEVVPSAPNSR